MAIVPTLGVVSTFSVSPYDMTGKTTTQIQQAVRARYVSKGEAIIELGSRMSADELEIQSDDNGAIAIFILATQCRSETNGTGRANCWQTSKQQDSKDRVT